MTYEAKTDSASASLKCAAPPPLAVVKVFHEQAIVGDILVRERLRLSFMYDPDWLSSDGFFPLSVTMPPVSDEFPDETVDPWITNLVPEGSALRLLPRCLHVSIGDPLGILRFMGGDMAGAVSIRKPSNPDKWDYELLADRYNSLGEGEALDCHFDEVRPHPFLANERRIRLTLAGAQRKTVLSVIDRNGCPKVGLPGPKDRLAIPKRGAPSTLVVKPEHEDIEGIVENEAYCLVLANLVGISAVECAVMQAGSRLALAVVRYDRRLGEDGRVRRLHQEDFAQANSLYPSQKYEGPNASGLDLCGLLRTGDQMSSPEKSQLVDQVVFNLLVGNTDAHAKNYSMILQDGFSMTPIYDVLSLPFWPEFEQTHAQRICGEKLKPCDVAGHHWDRIAEDADLDAGRLRRRVRSLADKMVEKREEAIRIVSDQPGVSLDAVRLVADVVEKNVLQIGGQLDDG